MWNAIPVVDGKSCDLQWHGYHVDGAVQDVWLELLLQVREGARLSGVSLHGLLHQVVEGPEVDSKLSQDGEDGVSVENVGQGPLLWQYRQRLGPAKENKIWCWPHMSLGQLKSRWVAQKALRWIVLFFFDAHAVLFTLSLLSTSFIKGLYYKTSWAHVWLYLCFLAGNGSSGASRKYRFSTSSGMMVDLDNGTILAEKGLDGVVQHVALAFCTSVLFLVRHSGS